MKDSGDSAVSRQRNVQVIDNSCIEPRYSRWCSLFSGLELLFIVYIAIDGGAYISAIELSSLFLAAFAIIGCISVLVVGTSRISDGFEKPPTGQITATVEYPFPIARLTSLNSNSNRTVRPFTIDEFGNTCLYYMRQTRFITAS